MISRRQTREYLLQLLYARSSSPDLDGEMFALTFFADKDPGRLDLAYLSSMETEIMAHERILIDTIARLAPKFEIDTLPTIHLLILMIALTEMNYLHPEKIPDKISVNEAIELARKFSDDQGRIFINGALSTYLKDRETIMLGAKTGTFRVFG